MNNASNMLVKNQQYFCSLGQHVNLSLIFALKSRQICIPEIVSNHMHLDLFYMNIISPVQTGSSRGLVVRVLDSGL